jgi:hypothetical protein
MSGPDRVKECLGIDMRYVFRFNARCLHAGIQSPVIKARKVLSDNTTVKGKQVPLRVVVYRANITVELVRRNYPKSF